MQVQLRPVEYRLLTAETPEGLDQDVNALLKKDWLLHGDTKVVHRSSDVQYSQPMVRLEARPVPMPSGLAMPSNIVVPQ